MKNSSYHFVNIDEALHNVDYNVSENHTADTLTMAEMEQESSCGLERLSEVTDDVVPKPKYYRLDRVIFAEPIKNSPTNTNEISTQDVGEITFIDNVMVKKTAGKRNKYFIDIKDGCLDCPVTNCSQTFSTKTLLKAHVRKVHCATIKHVCEECGAGFTAPYLLRRHSAVHEGGKVQCAECGKWLSRRTDMSSHVRTHGAARLGCGACARRFRRLSALRRHARACTQTAT